MLRGSCYVKSEFTETPRKSRCAAFVIDTSGAVFLFDDDLDRQLNEIPSYLRSESPNVRSARGAYAPTRARTKSLGLFKYLIELLLTLCARTEFRLRRFDHVVQ